MSEYKKIKISDFSYNLPAERIAKYPLAKRDRSKLLIWNGGTLQEDCFRNIPAHVPSDSMLVFNNTRVIHARLFFRKETGARIEIFCLEPLQPSDYQLAFQQTGKVVWKCMVGNAKKWKEGNLARQINFNGKTVDFNAKKVVQKNNTYHIEFTWNHDFTFAEIIEKSGVLPIPPYLKRETEPADELTYQTIYAKNNGSVAAPTAGLHFTENVLSQLAEKNIDLEQITLHVGAGTFQPVKSETIDMHTMHHEKVVVSKSFIGKLVLRPRKIIAVGTTSVRSLESLYWLGLKLEKQAEVSGNIDINQWEPYENEALISVQKALENILNYLKKSEKETLQFSTQIIIVPGYEFKLIHGMFTNFHQPQSTLLLLIGAFLGPDWKKVYKFALENDFRFLSYGDSNLYLK